jgi:hypothetical protein
MSQTRHILCAEDAYGESLSGHNVKRRFFANPMGPPVRMRSKHLQRSFLLNTDIFQRQNMYGCHLDERGSKVDDGLNCICVLDRDIGYRI